MFRGGARATTTVAAAATAMARRRQSGGNCGDAKNNFFLTIYFICPVIVVVTLGGRGDALFNWTKYKVLFIISIRVIFSTPHVFIKTSVLLVIKLIKSWILMFQLV